MYTVEDLLRDIEADIEKAKSDLVELKDDENSFAFENNHRRERLTDRIKRLQTAGNTVLTYQYERRQRIASLPCTCDANPESIADCERHTSVDVVEYWKGYSDGRQTKHDETKRAPR